MGHTHDCLKKTRVVAANRGGIFSSPWVARGVRLSLIVGIMSAAWHSWMVFSQYHEDQRKWIQMSLTYECVARLKDDDLNWHANEFGYINVKDLCFTDRDFWVGPYEIADVRKGTMKFETSWQPFVESQKSRAPTGSAHG